MAERKPLQELKEEIGRIRTQTLLLQPTDNFGLMGIIRRIINLYEYVIDLHELDKDQIRNEIRNELLGGIEHNLQEMIESAVIADLDRRFREAAVEQKVKKNPLGQRLLTDF